MSWNINTWSSDVSKAVASDSYKFKIFTTLFANGLMISPSCHYSYKYIEGKL